MHGPYYILISYNHGLGMLDTLVNWIYMMVITKYQCTHRIGSIILHALLGWLWPGMLQSLYAAVLHTHTHISMCSTLGQPKFSPYIEFGSSCYPDPQVW